MATLTLNPSADTYTYETIKTDNYATDEHIDVRYYAGRTRTSLIKFDLSSLPAGAKVSSVKLRLYFYDSPAVDTTVTAYRLLRDWVENQATWNEWKTGSSWTTGGAQGSGTDHASTSMGSVVINGTGWFEITLDLDEFEEWRAANYGLTFRRTAGYGDYRIAYSSDTTTGDPPELVIEFTPPSEGSVWFM